MKKINLAILLVCAFVAWNPGHAASCEKDNQQYKTVDGHCLDLKTGLLWGEPSRFGTDYKGAEEYCAASFGGESERCGDCPL